MDKELLFQAYLAGFENSSEGYNGEVGRWGDGFDDRIRCEFEEWCDEEFVDDGRSQSWHDLPDSLKKHDNLSI